jgi:hypothetical protein
MPIYVKSSYRHCESNRRSHCVHIQRPFRVVCRYFAAQVEQHVSSACLRALQHLCSLCCSTSASEQKVLHYTCSVFLLAKSASSFARCTPFIPHIPGELGISLYLIILDLSLHSKA